MQYLLSNNMYAVRLYIIQYGIEYNNMLTVPYLLLVLGIPNPQID